MFSVKVKVYFYDCDPAGILFYANVFKLAHSAYEELMKSLSLDKDYFNDKNYVLPITHSEADYFLPIKSGEELTVEIIVTQLKNSSFELSYQFCNQDSQTASKVKTVHVCAAKEKFAKTEMPSDLYEKLKLHLS